MARDSVPLGAFGVTITDLSGSGAAAAATGIRSDSASPGDHREHGRPARRRGDVFAIDATNPETFVKYRAIVTQATLDQVRCSLDVATGYFRQ